MHRMVNSTTFENNAERYDNWFERYPRVYQSEINAIKSLVTGGFGLEVGVGTGRFAQPLKVEIGLDPSFNMLRLAKKRGVKVVRGFAEHLPFRNEIFDFVLLVTTICFVDDVYKSLEEAYRVLKQGGAIVVGFVDRESPLGKLYQRKRGQSVFYKEAKFYSVQELLDFLKKAGFSDFVIKETLFGESLDIPEVQPVEDWTGRGSFVVIKGFKRVRISIHISFSHVP